jgi:hypothetical protein
MYFIFKFLYVVYSLDGNNRRNNNINVGITHNLTILKKDAFIKVIRKEKIC